MSLNSSERMVFDYVQTHPEERQYWVEKVRKTSAACADDHSAAAALEPDLWRYFEERSAVASPFKDAARHQGVRRTSMKNLAEHLLRLWTEPRPKKRPANPLEFYGE
jgi:hypothetical protein